MLAWLVALAVLMVTGCTANLDAAAEPTAEAVQLSEETQAYIDRSRTDLARRLGAPGHGSTVATFTVVANGWTMLAPETEPDAALLEAGGGSP